MKLTPKRFQTLLLNWFDQHGRKTLPWQQNKTPYRVFISEVMLQQTQVSTVIPYFERFMQRFPDLSSLASAKEDEVLHLWAGLGYYSRARNLHAAAKMVMEKFRGKFPSTLDDLQALPGIGRSTAGAILSIAFQTPSPILDGNVKRVLTRLHGIEKPVNDKQVETALWMLAERFTPTARVADYTQAIMDLGATYCTRSKPQCAGCPFNKVCVAHLQGIAENLPMKKAVKKIPTREATFLIIKKGSKILLTKRPSAGIWGGLFCLPEITGKPDIKTIREFCRKQLQITAPACLALKSFRHTFSHFHLAIYPMVMEVKKLPLKIMEEGRQIWYNLEDPESVGLPKPVQFILRGLM